jgi:hypothetical protein
MLAGGVAQLSLAGRIGLGQGLCQVPERMGLTKLIAPVGEHRGPRRHQALLFVAEHGQNRPLQGLERFEEGVERGLLLLQKPATA